MYFVVECVTMSHPNSNGRHSTGVGKVLSTMSGTPFLCAILANFAMSRTSPDGFATVSPKTHFVFGRNAFWISAGDASGSTNVNSMPSFFSETANRLKVPPYICADETTWSPALQRFRTENVDAAWPDDVSIAATPPSSAAIFFATWSFVGLARRV